MTGKSRPRAAQCARLLHRSIAVEDDAFAKCDHDRIAMHPDAVAGLDFDIAVKLDMGMKMLRALLDLDPAWRIE
jgi:hypothetical protein